jgi:hypothetical protein
MVCKKMDLCEFGGVEEEEEIGEEE